VFRNFSTGRSPKTRSGMAISLPSLKKIIAIKDVNAGLFENVIIYLFPCPCHCSWNYFSGIFVEFLKNIFYLDIRAFSSCLRIRPEENGSDLGIKKKLNHTRSMYFFVIYSRSVGRYSSSSLGNYLPINLY
jgi:hypothetical protein